MFDALRLHFVGAMENYSVTAILATIFTALMEYTGGEAEAFIVWCLFSALDLIFGVGLALMRGNFDSRKLGHWTLRIGSQLLVIIMFAGILHMFKFAAGVELVFANWLLFFFALMDFSSVVDKLALLGLMPKPALVLVVSLRRRSSKLFSAMIDDPRLQKELEHALRNRGEVA